jgi:hypothetical protein
VFHSRCTYLLLIMVFAVSQALAQGNSPPPPKPIQDNSFLVEEAYNQEYGVVQHISTFMRQWNSKDWVYTFTQEWPAPGIRHQLSYTLAYQHSGAFGGSGIKNVLLNYRYQMIGSGQTRIAFAPRLSALFPTGDSRLARGAGGFGLQTQLPLSVVLTPKLVSHWDAGATFIPHAQDSLGNHAFSAGYNLGQSFIWLAKPRFNLMLETVFGSSQLVIGSSRTEWGRYLYLNPGIRWAYNLKSGLQIVPGIAAPLGLGPSQGERGMFLYLSFEHPFRKIPAE